MLLSSFALILVIFPIGVANAQGNSTAPASDYGNIDIAKGQYGQTDPCPPDFTLSQASGKCEGQQVPKQQQQQPLSLGQAQQLQPQVQQQGQQQPLSLGQAQQLQPQV